MAEFKLGETYSGYQFLDVIRRSKRGVEYRVRNTLAQRIEVLRTLPLNAGDDQEQMERFLREMRVRARLVHANIVTLFNAIELENQLVMTTELVEGPSLAERIQLGPIPWREAVGLMRQALAAVGFAHQQHVIHRDIHPGNIVLTPEGELKLANFGLAKVENSPKLTQVGSVVGNPKYISPEQVRGTGELDARSDLYSLGIVFYEMLCGRPPFESESQFELMMAHMHRTPTQLRVICYSIPPALERVVLKMLEKDPARRYASAAEVDAALSAVSDEPAVVELTPAVASRPAAAAAPVGPPPVPLPAPVFVMAKRSSFADDWLVYGGIAACFSLLVMVAWLVAMR